MAEREDDMKETGAIAKKIVIVGAGILGASIAFHLVELGAHVTVLDAAEPGNGASGVSFAWINGRDKNRVITMI